MQVKHLGFRSERSMMMENNINVVTAALKSGIPFTMSGLEKIYNDYRDCFDKSVVYFANVNDSTRYLVCAFRDYLFKHPDLVPAPVYLGLTRSDLWFNPQISAETIKQVYLDASPEKMAGQSEITDDMLEEIIDRNGHIIASNDMIKRRFTSNLRAYHQNFLEGLYLQNEKYWSVLDFDSLDILRLCTKRLGTPFIVKHFKEMNISFTSLSRIPDLPLDFIQQRPSRFSWCGLSEYHDMTIPFINAFETKIDFSKIGNINTSALYSCRNDINKISGYVSQNVDMDVIEQYGPRLDVLSLFSTLLVNALNGKCDFEQEVEKRSRDFFRLDKNCLKMFVNTNAFSKEFLTAHYKDFTSHKMKGVIQKAINKEGA